MGRETQRPSIVSRVGLFATFFLFLVPAITFSAGEPGDYVQWFEALKNGTPDEKAYALSYTPASFDCCKLQKDPDALNLFLKALKDKDHHVREAAAASVRDLGTFSASCCRETQLVPALVETLKDIHPHVREEVARTLAFLKDERIVDALISKTGDEDPWVRLNVAFALGEMGGVKAVDPLLKLLEDESDWRNKFVQQEALIALRKIGDPQKKGDLQKKGIPIIMKKFNDPYLKAEVIKILGTFRVEEAKDLFLEASHDSNERIRKLAIEALSQLSLPGRAGRASGPTLGREAEARDVEVFMKGLKDPSAEVRARSAETLGRLEESRAVDPLIEALSDPDGMVRNQAIAALGHFQDERILDVLINFQTKDRGFYPPDALERTFESVTSKMSKERVYVYRKEGVRQVSRRSIEIPKGEKYDELKIHPVAVGKLIKALNSGDSTVRTRALEMIDSFEDDRIEGNLIKCLKDPSPRIRQKAISLLRIYGSDKVVPMLIEALKDREGSVRGTAADTLGVFKDKRSFEPLVARLNDNDDDVRAAALRSLGNLDDEKVSDINIELLKDRSASVRRVAVSYVKRKPDNSAVEPLIALLGDQDVVIAAEAAEALGLIGDRRAVGPLTDVLEGKYDRNRGFWEKEVRKKAAAALGAIGDKEAVPALIRALDDKELKVSAISSLGLMKDRSAVPALIKCLSDENLHVRSRAAAALRAIGDPAGLEAVKQHPPEITIPVPGSAVVSRVVKAAPGPPKDPSHRAGYDPMWSKDRMQTEEKQLLPMEEKTIPAKTPPPAHIEKMPRIEPQPRTDIKPLIAKLKADDPRTRREAADLLGDAGNKEATDSLIPLLRDRDDYVRQAVARALGKLRDKKSVEPLIVSLKDPDLYVRAFSAWALGEIQDPRALEPLCGSLSDKEEKVKERSFEALRNYSDPAAKRMMVNTLINNARIRPSYEWMLPRLINLEGKEVILKALEDPGGDRAQTIGNYIDLMETNIYNVSDIATQALVDYPDRGVVISGLSNYIGYQAGTGRITRSIILLGRLKDRRGLPVLLDTLDKKKGSYDRVTVIDAIGEIGDKGTVELLLKIFVDEKEPLGPRMAAARALGKLGDPRAVEPLLRVARDEGGNKEIRKDAAYALGLLGDKRAVDPLINILKNKKEDGWLRVAAAASLGNIGDERAIGPLQETQEDSYVQNAAQSALKKIRAK